MWDVPAHGGAPGIRLLHGMLLHQHPLVALG
jgi:hypothetical protein